MILFVFAINLNESLFIVLKYLQYKSLIKASFQINNSQWFKGLD